MPTATLEPRTAHRPARRPVAAARYEAPLLDNGYRLSQPEFHRRYSLLPALKKAELIEGRVVMGSPIHLPHALACGMSEGWLFNYAAETDGVEMAANVSTILDGQNEYQPDAVLLVRPECGGQIRALGDHAIQGAPELVVEVALTSVAHDLGDKFQVYRRAGVREYLVWQLAEGVLDWFVLEAGEYVRLEAKSGLLRSQVFPGLWLDAAALRGDKKKVLAQLRRGLASAEHAAFVKKLSVK
jgi:Uma2 family endonuclease